MRYLVVFLFFLSSCQFWKGWFSNTKDYTLTQLASQATGDSIDENYKEDLIYLFEDLNYAKNCDDIRVLIENNSTLIAFEKQYDLPTGFLFDELFNYDYEKSLIKWNRTKNENVAFSIVSVWKTKFSIAQINPVIETIGKCYPNEYLDD